MSSGLGRGLSSLIPPKENQFSVREQVAASAPELQQASTTVIVEIPIDRIVANSHQPRQHFDPQRIDELAQSIETHGLLEPVVVTTVEGQESYQLVAGERRFRAFKQLHKKSIPAIVRDTSELERLELALIENIQREDLNPIEKANSMAKLVNDFGLTQVEAAKKLGVARSSLANTIRLLDLPGEIQHGLSEGKISEGHAKILLGLASDRERMQVYTQLASGAKGMSVRELSDSVKQKKPGGTKKRSIADYELQAMEDRLQGRLGTKVTIKPKVGGGTQIIIETYSGEDFKRVVDTIG